MQVFALKKGQVSVFVVLAIVVVAGVLSYFIFSGSLRIGGEPAEVQTIYTAYGQCIENEVRAALDLAGTQGGHLFPKEVVPGSEYAPFSSEFNFLGFSVPYWFYVSGNGIVREQIPSLNQIEGEIEEYVASALEGCDLDSYYSEDLFILAGEPEVDVSIEDSQVVARVESDLVIHRAENSFRKGAHQVNVVSNFGKLYSTAREIYDYQRETAFLENYSADVLRLYAPVDGVEIACNPRIWKTGEVFNEVQNALEANIGALKFSGQYYELLEEQNRYFVVDKQVDGVVNLLYSKSWPGKFEVVGGEDGLLVAQPVGLQEGLGFLGFCYSPYHFVYDMSFPVLIQVSNQDDLTGQEIFQFPVVVVIDNNLPRQAELGELLVDEGTEGDACAYNTQDLEVGVFNTNLEPVDANLTYSCFNDACYLGETEEGKFKGFAPACLNGYLEVQAEGYSLQRQLLSTNEETSADVILDREYDVELEVRVDGKPLVGQAFVSFEGARSASVALPELTSLKLTEGIYNVSVQVYGNSSIVIPASSSRQCTEVTSGGILSFFGGTKEECFDVNLPETKVSFALVGGGQTQTYFLPDDLERGKIIIDVDSLPKPESLEQLQYNYEAIQTGGIRIL